MRVGTASCNRTRSTNMRRRVRRKLLQRLHESNVMSKLDAMKGRSDEARKSLKSTEGNLAQLKLEHALKMKQEEKAKAKRTQLEGQLKEKAAKTEGDAC